MLLNEEIKQRREDLLKLIASLDIPDSMYQNAKEKYEALAHFLENIDGIQANMYPQGSFSYRTVVRPLKKGDDDNYYYDLDFICEVTATCDTVSAEQVRQSVEKALKASNQYKDKIDIDDRCITVSYAECNGYGFKIDIVPAAAETDEKKQKLKNEAEPENAGLVDSAIAITEKRGSQYKWITSNPKGMTAWFDSINSRFPLYNEKIYKGYLVEGARFTLNESVEALDDEQSGRTSLQVVIQILKHHRDVFYDTLGDEYHLISAIITTIVTTIAKEKATNVDVFALLDDVVKDLALYSQQQSTLSESFAKSFPNKRLIRRVDGKWIIANPANPEDNLADSWTDKDAKMFFNWAKQLGKDMSSINEEVDDFKFRTVTENAFGGNLVKSVWGEKYQPKNVEPPRPIHSSKPWTE